MANLTPIALWKSSPRQLVPTEYNFAAAFNDQHQDVLNQSEYVKSLLANLSGLLSQIESKGIVLAAINAQIIAAKNQLNPVLLQSENNAIEGRLDTIAAGIVTISTAKSNAEIATTATESALAAIKLDTKVQRLSPVLTELAALGKFNDRNLTIAGGKFNWSGYAGVKVKPQIALLMENQPLGTNGGAVAAVNTWNPRNLNTIKFLSIDNGGLSNNILTLPAGDYVAVGVTTFAGSATAKTRLQKGAVTLGIGASGNGTTEGGNVGRITNNQIPIYSAFSLSELSNISLDFVASNNPAALSSATQGRACGLDSESYTQLLIIAATPQI